MAVTAWNGINFAEKINRVTNALGAANGGISLFNGLGLFQNGGGRRNNIQIKNNTDEKFDLHNYYLHWGKCSVPPNPVLHKHDGDSFLFINAGSWAATGSSGLVQWELPHEKGEKKKYLFLMWDAPFNFDFSNNFIGLWLNETYNSKPIDIGDTDQGWQVFKEMYLDLDGQYCKLSKSYDFPGTPKKGSKYHLVSCGPGYKGEGPWGFREPCHVKNDKFEIKAMMGDRHEGETVIDIMRVGKN